MTKFARLDRLPPYVFATVNGIKMEARRAGQDIIDLGMGNPDLGTPEHIVDKLIEASRKPHNHRYSASMGITKLRTAISDWYQRRFNVQINPDTEAIVTIGVKEGLSHLILVIHDFAYADLVFDGYKAPSLLQVKGAKDVGVEFFSLSKSYSMPGWRVGFCVGSKETIAALRRIKSYLDYGIFQPIQIAAIIALNGPYDCVEEIRQTYQERRDTLISGLNRTGWDIPSPICN